MSRRAPSALPSVYDHSDEREPAGVLAALRNERSKLRAEVERLAAALLGNVRVESVAVEVGAVLVELELADLAVRAGRQPGASTCTRRAPPTTWWTMGCSRSSTICVVDPDW